MNWRQFTVALVQALAWPSVAVVVLLVYRRRIAQLLGDNLRRLQVGPIAAEWEKVAEETRATIEAAETVPQTVGAQRELPSAALDVARRFVDGRPSLAIVYGWQAAMDAFDAHLPMDDEELSQITRLSKLLRRARARGLVTPGAALVFERLHTLRNLAVHPGGQSEEPSAEQAKEFLDLVGEFLALLDKPSVVAGRELPAQPLDRVPSDARRAAGAAEGSGV